MDIHQHTRTPPGLTPGPGFHHSPSTYMHGPFNTCSQQSAFLARASLDTVAAARAFPRHNDMNTMALAPLGPPSDHAYPEPATNSAPMTRSRKRKADSQENERLSKRLSLLNLEKNGERLYVPVESPHLRPTSDENSHALPSIPEDDNMRLDDSAHRVYIYNLDDELSSSDTESTCSEDSNHRLVFLADIDKHLRQNRIPPSIFANQDGEIAGTNLNDMQMVLYSDPTSLTVPEEEDSVRRAVMEARNRIRQRQRDELGNNNTSSTSDLHGSPARLAPIRVDSLSTARSSPTGLVALSTSIPGPALGTGIDEMDLD
ncbi:DUF6649 domain-containing protein [Microdochium nivale]|nr:DUF6649 domain-containing protein [Microdochium nivale]